MLFLSFLGVLAGFERGLGGVWDDFFARMAGAGRGQKTAIVKIQRVRRYLV